MKGITANQSKKKIIFDSVGFHVCVHLWSVVRFIELPRLAGPLLYTVVLAWVPLDQRRILGRLGSVGDTQLHDHHPRSRSGHS